MIRFHALGIRFTLPLLTLMFPILAVQLGMRGSMGSLLIALSMHELAHVAAAKWLGVGIQEIRLTPFGGSARMENPYGVPAHRIIPVAAAGPAMNLLLAVVSAALAQWRLLTAQAVMRFVQYNLVLCIFNLLPALPLDGGRILFALLQRRLGEGRALALGVWLGRLVAAGLLLLTLAGGLMGRRWNLSFVLAAVFLLSSARDERSALYKSQAQRLYRRQDGDAILPVRIYQASESTTVCQALALLRPKERCFFLIAKKTQPAALVDEDGILAHILQNGAADAPLGELVSLAPELHAAAPRS